MKQPELGRKIALLRQQNNMTQEELVDACNVSVRTIQRIESGDVTPRISTIKIILAALGEDMDFVYQVPQQDSTDQKLQVMETWLQIAWIAGIVAFVMGFIDTSIEVFRSEGASLDIPWSLYLLIKGGSLISYTLFYIGLIKLGDFFENQLLSVACYVLISLSVLMTGTDIISVFYEGTWASWVTIGTGLLMGFGAAGIVLGFGLLRLQDAMGTTAKAAGILEIIGGICLLTIILSLLGFFIYIPTMIMEIILLYKALEYVKIELKK